MLLKDLPEKLQDFAILRMVEYNLDYEEKVKIHKDIEIVTMFLFYNTEEYNEWCSIHYENNLEPMYTKYPELR